MQRRSTSTTTARCRGCSDRELWELKRTPPSGGVFFERCVLFGVLHVVRHSLSCVARIRGAVASVTSFGQHLKHRRRRYRPARSWHYASGITELWCWSAWQSSERQALVFVTIFVLGRNSEMMRVACSASGVQRSAFHVMADPFYWHRTFIYLGVTSGIR